MKLDARRREQFLRRPDPAMPIVLLHGPDAGLIAERGELLGRSVVEDLRDPFRVSELTGDQLRQSPTLLVEEAQSLCLMSGRRLVRVRLAGETMRPALELLLGLERPEALVTIEADDLPASSKLRQLAERSPRVAVIACYHDNERDLAATLDDSLREHGLQLEPAARAYLQANLGGDRGVTRRELEKLALFCLDQEGRIGLDQVAAVVGDASALALDEAIFACLRGEQRRLDPLLDRLFKEGTAPMRVLRAMEMTTLALLRLRLRLEGGEAEEAVLAGVRPPFGPVRERYRAVLGIVTGERLEHCLGFLQEAELRCKSAGSPDALLARQVLGEICRSQAVARRGPGERFRTDLRSGPPHRA